MHNLGDFGPSKQHFGARTTTKIGPFKKQLGARTTTKYHD